MCCAKLYRMLNIATGKLAVCKEAHSVCVSTLILCSLYKLNQLTNVLLTPHAQEGDQTLCTSITELCSPTSTAIMYCPICIAPFAIRSSTFITPPVSFVSLAAPNACGLYTHTHTV